jgi:2-dehydro-3-deoxyphosphogluconate aldolase / (4S)-4-hydroxy-2-oxoglutarate aldolase
MSSQTHCDAIDAMLARAPALPVLVLEDVPQALTLARVLVDAGLPVLEVTLRTPAALDCIRAIADAVPDAIVGAGTVLSRAQLDKALSSGARFAIAPGATPQLLRDCRDAPIPLLPGIASASDIMAGLELGYERFKFFPAAAAGGVNALKNFAGPFAQVRFCPTGGIDIDSAPAYLALQNVMTVGGSWMVPGAALKAQLWDQIGSLARAAAGLKKAN